MNPEKAIDLLAQLRDESGRLPVSTSSPEFHSWHSRAESVLAKALGASHHITEAFRKVTWGPFAYGGDDSVLPAAFRSGLAEAQGLLDAAVFELRQLRETVGPLDEGGFDPELWEHVGSHLEDEEWGKVASQAAIFTEDRIRRWAGRPADEVGERLMTAVFGERGDYRLGTNESEKQGWHRLAMGLSMAVRNVDLHRIQRRPDLRRYAMGVLGSSSLLLTQLRFEHGNRFHDVSRMAPADAEPLGDRPQERIDAD